MLTFTSPSFLAVHHSPHDIAAGNSFTTSNMTVTNTDNAVSVANRRYGRARKWLQQRIQKAVPRQILRHTKVDTHIQRKASLKRPSTAPAIGTTYTLNDITLIPTAPLDIKSASSRPPIPPPIRPMRPDSSVMRDINAWLEASTDDPSPPLMSGLSYWKEAMSLGVKDSASTQHAVPLSVASGAARPTTAPSQQTRYFRRPAMKVQVRMPSLLRTTVHHPTGRYLTTGQSTTMPPLAISYENVRECVAPRLMATPPLAISYENAQQGVAPMMVTQSKCPLTPLIPPLDWHTSTRDGVLFVDQLPQERSPSRHNMSTRARLCNAESDSQRRMNKIFMHTAQGADHTRPSTAAPGPVREGSMGDLSDAPTYSSGPPPPSYRSRPDSALTTSSFGCIDGMNPVQRQISQQRAALQRGVRYRLKRLAQNFAI